MNIERETRERTEVIAPAKVLCIGELLIDFICTDIDADLKNGEHFIKKAGGAPANVAAALAQMGAAAYFAGKVGQDAFGDFLENTLKEKGVDTTMLVRDPGHATTLAFVSLDSRGERDFMFSRGADAHHRSEDLDLNLLDQCRILHFGSATALLGGDSRETYLELLAEARRAGRFISFDPNYRGDLWKGAEQAFIARVLPLLAGVDLLKVSESELALLSGETALESGVRFLHEQGAGIVAVTLGENGTFISNGSQTQRVETIKVRAVDSTGAGDAFVGAFLSRTAEMADPKDLAGNFESLIEFTAFANRVGAMVCTRPGAIDAIPSRAEVLNPS